MTKGLTNKQINVLQYIYDTINSQGYPPTVREIGAAVGLSSSSTVHGHLSRLEKGGYLIKDPTKNRTLEITELGFNALGMQNQNPSIPLLGVVAAGEPILAVEEATDYFPIPPEFANESSDLFMLTIRGESMIDAGILSGDQVIVRKQSSAINGEIVIAMTDENEATCKRFYKEDGYIKLEPENETMEPIILDDVTILGKVVGLFRNDIF